MNTLSDMSIPVDIYSRSLQFDDPVCYRPLLLHFIDLSIDSSVQVTVQNFKCLIFGKMP